MGYYVATTTVLGTVIPDFTEDTATASLFGQCITDAEAEVNKWLSRRYDLSAYQTTSAAVPPMVRSLALKYAEGLFWGRASRGAKESLARAKDLKNEVLTNLKDIAEYRANLVDTSGALVPNSTDNQGFRVLSNTTDYAQTFSEKTSTSWRVNRDKLDDEDL